MKDFFEHINEDVKRDRKKVDIDNDEDPCFDCGQYGHTRCNGHTRFSEYIFQEEKIESKSEAIQAAIEVIENLMKKGVRR